MRRLAFGAITALALTGTALAETVSELSDQGLVLLSSHADSKGSVVTFIMGDIQGSPKYVCVTRFVTKEGDTSDQCRKMQ